MFRLSCVNVMMGSTLLVLAGCESSSEKKTSGEQVSSHPSAALPAGLILTAAPADAQNVIEAKKKAKTGDDIVVRGKIGGQVKPFVEGRAVFQLVDSSLPTCNMTPGDTCETPWDYCCEPKDQIAAKSMTVQVVGEDGKPLKIDLNGHDELKPMARVVVRGKVAERPDEKTLTLQAKGIFVDTTSAKGS